MRFYLIYSNVFLTENTYNGNFFFVSFSDHMNRLQFYICIIVQGISRNWMILMLNKWITKKKINK